MDATIDEAQAHYHENTFVAPVMGNVKAGVKELIITQVGPTNIFISRCTPLRSSDCIANGSSVNNPVCKTAPPFSSLSSPALMEQSK